MILKLPQISWHVSTSSGLVLNVASQTSVIMGNVLELLHPRGYGGWAIDEIIWPTRRKKEKQLHQEQTWGNKLWGEDSVEFGGQAKGGDKGEKN